MSQYISKKGYIEGNVLREGSYLQNIIGEGGEFPLASSLVKKFTDMGGEGTHDNCPQVSHYINI